jgi:lysozyme family protein
VPADQDQARQNYATWLTKTRLDRLPDDLRFADAVIDYAVNSGESPAIKALQRAVGLPAAQQDGVIGPVTIAQWTGVTVPPQWRDKVFAARLRTIGGWVHSDPAHAVPLVHGVMDRIASALET